MKTMRICDLLEQKLNAFERFLSATTSLRGMPDFQNNREVIVSLINERQRCITAIDRIDGRLNRIRREGPALVSRVSNETGGRIRRLETMIRDLATKAGQISKECEAMLALWHDDIKNQMMRVRQGRNGIHSRAGKAYRTRQPKFFDMTL
jgi:hypothetical protein